MICGAATLTALCRVPRGIIHGCAETNQLSVLAMTEVIAVGRAAGVRLDDKTLERCLAACNRAPPTHKSSLYVDLINGKRLELEQLNGALVRLGAKYGVPTPINFTIYAALKPHLNGPPVLPV